MPKSAIHLRTLLILSLSVVAQLPRFTLAQQPPPAGIAAGEAPPAPIPPAFPPASPNLDYGARMRIVTRLQGVDDPERLNDVSQLAEADLYMSGQLHRMIKWQAGVTFAYAGTLGASNLVQVQPLDVIARFEPFPELSFAVGRMIIVADRFLPGGPWNTDEFYYHGFAGSVPVPALPKSGPNGRDLGVNMWGAPLAGHIKYYLGAYQLHDPGLDPLLSGRLQVTLWNGEPAFYQRTTYFGTRDILSIGGGAQYQKAGSVQSLPAPQANTMAPPPLTDDYWFATADLVFEKTLGDSGTLSAYGAYSKFGGDYRRWDHYWLASLGYMFPQTIGIGKVRATVRYQRGLEQADAAQASSILDAQLSYNVMAWFARLQLGYRRMELFQRATTSAAAQLAAGNQIYLGVTLADP